MTRVILGLVGPLAAGKGSVAKYLKEKYQVEVFRFSTPLRDALNRFYLEQTRKNMQDLSLILRQTFGDDLLARVIAQDVKNANNQIIIVDGVRRDPDIKYLRLMPGFRLISIVTDQKTRWERMIKRGENTDDMKKTFAQFQKDEQAEAETYIQKVAKSADFTIDNNGNFKGLYQQIENILNKINESR